ncbi:hypothetical protein [Streptomyces sp. NPDC048252]|uniref:hypothetical protein n=1 Tax=Streptomyces sp. NPDC048252 TaxID=3154612 RepID=UPI00342AC075
MVERNDEGVLVVGTRAAAGYRGIPFTEESVLGYAEHPGTLTRPAGRAHLRLACRPRHEPGSPGPGSLRTTRHVRPPARHVLRTTRHVRPPARHVLRPARHDLSANRPHIEHELPDNEPFPANFLTRS